MSEIGIAMDGRAPIADIPAQARAAEDGSPDWEAVQGARLRVDTLEWRPVS